MKKQLLMVALVSCFAAGHASAMTQDEYKVAKERIEADHKVDKTKCDTLEGNAKDVCNKQADGKEKIAKAELEQQYKPSASHARNVEQQKVETAYDVAMEKCEDQRGDAKNACEKQAKADQAQGKAQVNAMKM
jgi:hypothetical protein